MLRSLVGSEMCIRDSSSGAGNKLSDALVSVGPAGRGGTGSFISADGLIITNHHVALDAVRQASLGAVDYLTNGFVAHSRQEELAGPDYEVWITRSCEDISAAVVEAFQSEKDPLPRANKVRDAKQQIASEREAALGEGMRCEVQEMFAAKSYVLFTFERLRDVRIVYVPPRSLGSFGGDADNFEWPRHTADFTLLRAYVGPDGQAADPSPENVPYQPKRFLTANPLGAQPGEFVFLLGFPGHTMRYAPASRLKYADQVAVPQLVTDFNRKLQLIEQYKDEPEVMMKLVSTQKSLANEAKRSAGKRVMMNKLGLLQEREAEEAVLRKHSSKAQSALTRLAELYDSLSGDAELDNALCGMRGVYAGSTLLYAGHTLHEAWVEAAKPDGERESAYRQRSRGFVVTRLLKKLKDAYLPLCLLYTSDAADEEDSVDLGGRRIIKKKKKQPGVGKKMSNYKK
eukprot:TRINITY_DN25461_c0_g1_i1.p1 TRINITY_DN25461_c0_g1~~TRINITY_DN25461_c0_g1_i1.p1  ORF type:complete len:487 (-),score=132.09 TRINITY_DN25461_c0_g1_i1:26-1396(-)